MVRSRLGLKALGLCALVVGLMAIGASAAQAEPGAIWDVNGAKLPEALLPTLAATLEGHATLLSTTGGKPFHILCSGVELKETHLVYPAGVLGFVKFTGCTFIELKAGVAITLTACEPHEGEEKGVIITKKTKGLILLHEFKNAKGEVERKEGVVEFEPETGTTFVTLHTSSKCAFGENIPIGGKVVFQDCQKAFSTPQVTHLIEYNVLSELWTFSNTAEHKATIDGSANVVLSGAHKGMTFNGLPG